MSDTALTAAIVIIGNEILSGRTQDTNTQWIAEKLGRRGINLAEVRVVPDIEEKIIEAVSILRERVTYVFTTGGIGPTHDDITAESIAAAFNIELEKNDEAYQMLLKHYGDESEMTDARMRMTMIPKGASLIPNPVSTAPGFIIENVHVMAGVPKIMQAMLDHVLPTLAEGKVVMSNSISCPLPESAMAEDLRSMEKEYGEHVEIGSYPHFRDGSLGLSVVLRSTEEDKLKIATEALLELIDSKGIEPNALSLQVPVD